MSTVEIPQVVSEARVIDHLYIIKAFVSKIWLSPFADDIFSHLQASMYILYSMSAIRLTFERSVV